MRRLCQLLSLTVCGWPAVLEVPHWAVASWLGTCWGTLLLTGLSATWAKNRMLWSLFAILTCVLSHGSLRKLTDLDSQVIWLLITLLLASGWIIGVALVPWRATTQSVFEEHRREPGNPKLAVRRFRFSAWDMFCATTLVGLLCWATPGVQWQFDLLCQIAPAFVGGIVLSLLALQWAWKDQWSLVNLAWAVICLLTATVMIVPWNTMDRDYRVIIAWLVSGPLCVMAAQFIAVLLWSATFRTMECESDSSRLREPDHLEPVVKPFPLLFKTQRGGEAEDRGSVLAAPLCVSETLRFKQR